MFGAWRLWARWHNSTKYFLPNRVTCIYMRYAIELYYYSIPKKKKNHSCNQIATECYRIISAVELLSVIVSKYKIPDICFNTMLKSVLTQQHMAGILSTDRISWHWFWIVLHSVIVSPSWIVARKPMQNQFCHPCSCLTFQHMSGILSVDKIPGICFNVISSSSTKQHMSENPIQR